MSREALKHIVTLFTEMGVVLGSVGSGISKDEHEKIVFELKKTKAELKKTRAELEKTKTKLEKGNRKIAAMEKILTKVQDQHNIVAERHKKEKQAMQRPSDVPRYEVAYLKQKLDDLIHGLQGVTSELDIAKRAKEILQDQMDERFFSFPGGQ